MIDYLMQTGNMGAMQNAVGKYNPDGRGTLYDPVQNVWRQDVTFFCQVYDSGAPMNGVFLWIALPNQDSYLLSIPACWIAADRGLAITGNPNYIIYNTMTQAQMNTRTIAPTVHGSSYPFMHRGS